MRAYYELGFPSWGVGRVALKLSQHLPAEIERAGDPGAADLLVLHVIGRHDHNLNNARRMLERGGQYAVIQYVLGSCRNPDPREWADLWDNAKVVWSYYNLPTPKLYHAPLAADPAVFYPEQTEKKYVVGSNGYDFVSECIGEVQLAAWQAGGKSAHVGQIFNANPIVDYYSEIDDDALRHVYNSCKHWAALRRKDGFEMPAVEALMCGVRPVVFDTPNYRQWFDGLADFIPEVHPGGVTGYLKRVIKQPPRPITEDEMAEVKRRFNWKSSVEGFWERCLS